MPGGGRRAGAGLLFLLISLIHPPSLGMGDAKLAVVLGMYTGFLGWGTFAAGLILSFVLGGVVSIGLLLSRRAASTEPHRLRPVSDHGHRPGPDLQLSTSD